MRRAIAGLLAASAVAAAGTGALPAAAGAALPDERAYEIVSPLDSRGLVFDEAWSWRDDDHALMRSGFDAQAHYLSTRTDAGWEVERVIPPPEAWVRFTPKVVDGADDMSRIVMAYALPHGELDQLGVRDADGTWAKVGDGVAFLARSSDARRVLVAPDAGRDPYPEVAGESGIFLWDDGEVSSVGDDDPRAATCGALLRDGSSGRLSGFDQSGFSRDGMVAALTTRSCVDPDTSETLLPHVLVWEDGETTDVSTPLAGEPDAAAAFAGNAVDGSAVFFTGAGRLDAGDAGTASDLFRHDVETGALERISAEQTDAGQTLRGVITSDDGLRAWFATYDPVADRDLLWVWTAGGAPEQIRAFDRNTLVLNPLQSAARPATASVDGAVLSWTGLTRGGGLQNVTQQQVFRATIDGDVRCVSCVDGVQATVLTLGTAMSDLSVPAARMSADGEHLFFETTGRLVAADGDATSDVYGWSGGQVWLVSAGSEQGVARLAGVSPFGDVYFRTFEQLLPWVDDDHQKVYVARIGGGQPAPALPPTCEGDGCQGDPRAQPLPDPAPPTTSHEGPGDVEDPEPPFARDPRYVAKLKLAKLSKAAKARLARGGKVALAVRSTEAGRVSATVRVRIGRRWVRAGGAARTLGDEGTARLTVRLSANARRTLARRGGLRVRIVVSHRAAKAPVVSAFTLKKPGRRAHA